eukprot:2224775-Alexandrium_andersonii.AAC.1
MPTHEHPATQTQPQAHTKTLQQAEQRQQLHACLCLLPKPLGSRQPLANMRRGGWRPSQFRGKGGGRDVGPRPVAASVGGGLG